MEVELHQFTRNDVWTFIPKTKIKSSLEQNWSFKTS